MSEGSRPEKIELCFYPVTSSEMDMLRQMFSALRTNFAKETKRVAWVWESEDRKKEIEEGGQETES